MMYVANDQATSNTATSTISFITNRSSDAVNTPNIGLNANEIIFSTGPRQIPVFIASRAERMRIDASGNVGIGTTSPNDSLDVVGDVDVTGCFQVNDTTIVGGTCISDIRLKKNVRPIAGSLERLTHLEPVSFEYADPSYGPGVQEGLIAQEVEKIFPEWIVTKEDGYKRIIYGLQLQMHLIQAVKELKADNEALNRRIEVLEGR